METLLLSKNVLEGPRRVTASLRPLRLAFLVDSDNPASALAAIASCTVSWGGALHLLIPCRAGGEPEGMWSFMLDMHDPDEIVDMVGASKALVDLHGEYLDRVVVRWEYESEPLMVRGAAVFSPLRLLKDRGDLRPDRVCPQLAPLVGHPFALPLAFRWGYLGGAQLPQESLLRAALESARHDDFVTLDPVDPASLAPDELIRLLTETTVAEVSDLGNNRPGWVKPFGYTLMDLTLTHIWPQATFQERWDLEPDERAYGQSHRLCVVVVGSPSSVPDLCLAWNLRAKRPGFDPFPIWVDPSWLRDGAIARRLDQAREDTRGLWIHKEIDPWLGLVSASLPRDELSALARLTHRTIRVNEQRFEELFPNRLRIGLERESIADFRDGQADVALPDLAKIGHFYQWETIAGSVEIEGWKSPKTAGPPFRSTEEITRVADDGIAGELRLFQRRPYDLIRVRLNPAWRVVTQVAERAGYAAESPTRAVRRLPS